MTTDEIKDAIAAGIQLAFKNPDLHCRYHITSEQHVLDHQVMKELAITAEQHVLDHQLMKQFAKNMGKISDIKFAVIKWFVIAVIALFCGWAGYGITHKIQGG